MLSFAMSKASIILKFTISIFYKLVFFLSYHHKRNLQNHFLNVSDFTVVKSTARNTKHSINVIPQCYSSWAYITTPIISKSIFKLLLLPPFHIITSFSSTETCASSSSFNLRKITQLFVSLDLRKMRPATETF